MNGPVTVNMGKLLSISVQLAGAACQIVKNYYLDKQTKTYLKGPEDYVTEADFKIQTMLIRGLRQYFPEVKIIGEQEKQFEGHIDTNYSNLSVLAGLKMERQCPSEQLCIWIDPIDCTKGFVKGNIQDVTILIGISQKQTAQMGVIGVPYNIISGQAIYNPKVIFGSVAQSLAYEYCIQKNTFHAIDRKQLTKIPTVVTSNSRITKLEDIMVKQLNAQKIRAGGSGRKADMVIRHGIHLACYPFQKTQKWDSCAADAIIRAQGGYFTDCYGDIIQYNPAQPKQSNINGYLCSFNKQMLCRSVQICKAYKNAML